MKTTNNMVIVAATGVFLLGGVSAAFAQTNNTYLEERSAALPLGMSRMSPEEVALIIRAERSHVHVGQRIGWNNSSSAPGPVDWADEATRSGKAALRGGDLVTAESDFRRAIAFKDDWSNAYIGLANVFTARGETGKAIQAYREVFYNLATRSFVGPENEAYRQKVYADPASDQFAPDGLRYAVLLSQSGQWPEAVIVYKSALKSVPSGSLPVIDVQFDASDPQPVAFEAASRMALGLILNFSAYSDKDRDAMKEYAAALRLEPKWALTNYYYGYGLRQLSPSEQAQYGTEQQAKAALLKAVKVGKGDIKKAAQKALRVAMNSKANPSVPIK